MSLILSLILSAAAAPTSEVWFEFVGQPECVTVDWTGDRTTRLENHCEAPILVDQSVALPTAGRSAGLLPPGATTEVRDQSAFTLGLDGELYRVVAVVSRPEDADREDGGEEPS